MALRIRLATPADAPQCAAIYAPHVRDSAVSFELAVPTDDEMALRITDTLERYPWLVCADGDAVHGYAYAREHQPRPAFQWSVDVSLYVADLHRRRGVGRRLYASLCACLRLLGYCNALAAIALPNPASVGLHQAMGFRRLGTFPDVGYKQGAWHSVEWWGLPLQARADPAQPLRPADVADTSAWDAALRGE